MFDAGYFWHYNELWVGGAAGPGEKAYVAGLILTVFSMRVAAAIGFLQMKRWGHQWMVVTCWMGVVIWSAYVFNMTMFAVARNRSEEHTSELQSHVNLVCRLLLEKK